MAELQDAQELVEEVADQIKVKRKGGKREVGTIILSVSIFHSQSLLSLT